MIVSIIKDIKLPFYAKGQCNITSYNLGYYFFHFYAGDVAQNILAVAGRRFLFRCNLRLAWH
jgi:hypothetical protein